VIKILLERWFSVFGKPTSIHSDNDVRFSREKGFYQSVLKAMQVTTHFSVPYRPQSNGVCENVNRQFLQNMRILMHTTKTQNWPALAPYVAWLMNSQVSPTTKLTPHELFHGRPAQKFEVLPEPCTAPQWIHG